MNANIDQDPGSVTGADLKSILMSSLLGTTGVMWVIGGFLAVIKFYDVNWVLAWLSAFVWIWGCWAAALYFDIKRFIS